MHFSNGSCTHFGATDEEIAVVLSRQEGRPVPVEEVRQVGARAMRKIKATLHKRGYTAENLIPELWRGPRRYQALNERNIPVGEDHPKARYSNAHIDQVLRMRDQGAGYGTIAKALGMPKTTVCNICNGRQRLQVATQYRVASA